jgi:hypothetical protein
VSHSPFRGWVYIVYGDRQQIQDGNFENVLISA